MTDDKSIKRRTILKTGLVAAAGTAALGALSTEQAIAKTKPGDSRGLTGEIPTRKFGSTRIKNTEYTCFSDYIVIVYFL